ncbi:MAG: nucleotide exchange factor GrpE [Lachnospiraceae bacterium]|nr:nucleotide exchange factor GrpE [Lachnospiraceae bacterium]
MDDQDEKVTQDTEVTDEAEVLEGEVEETEAEESCEAETEEPEDAQTEDAEEEAEAEAETAEEESSDDKDADKPKKKKGLFGKKEKEKDKRDEKIDELTDKLMRSMAEFENFRKRTEKEKTAMFDLGAKGVVEKLLPVIDNFERGFDSIKEAERDTDSFVSGMDMVYKQLMKVLEDMGVEVIDTKDKEFDPNLHNAVMHIEDEKYGENMIVQEFQKGYTYKGTVVRHSMVQVAN